MTGMDIEIIHEKTTPERVREHAQATFGDMVKVVVDIERGRMAIGGELHADAEAALLNDGSKQADLWGANIIMEKPPGENIEYNSLINIRPSQGNRSRDIQDAAIRDRVRAVLARLTGMV
jgi:hypothetical protein